QLVNSTVVYNGQIGVRAGGGTVVNSIIWGQTNDISALAGAVSYSDTAQGSLAGTNHNISADPQFVAPLAADYQLLPSSPPIDIGNSAAANLPATDMDGQPRVQGQAVDMGAYEATPAFTMTLQADPALVGPGAPLTYTLRLTNTSSFDLHLVVTDVLPSQVSP